MFAERPGHPFESIALWIAAWGNAALALASPLGIGIIGMLYIGEVERGGIEAAVREAGVLLYIGSILLGLFLVIGYFWVIFRGVPMIRPRWFWTTSALYNVMALVFWAQGTTSTLGALYPALVLWIAFMFALSVWEVWQNRPVAPAE